MNRGAGLGLVVLCTALVVALLVSMGAVKMNLPGLVPDVTHNEVSVFYPELPTIVAIEPIALDCHARIEAEIPVTGRKEHKLLGQVYRTDTVEMLAIGDVDTCVHADDIVVVDHPDGSKEVLIPGEAIVFNRPRVDAEATRDSVRFDKGLMGKFTDVLPWVSDGEGLTPAAYAFAQQVVGSSDCMEAAYSVTRTLLEQAYADQARTTGFAGDLAVRIVGTPDFGQNEPTEPDSDFDLRVDAEGARCRLAGDLDLPAEVTSPSDQS